jgi:nucleoid DNA-binding protein
MKKGTYMTKRDIVLKIANDTHKLNSHKRLTKNQIAEVVQCTLNCISDELSAGNHIELRDFGVFKIAVAKPRKGRNPNKPENEVIIPEHVVVKFKPGLRLKKNISKINIPNIK